MKTCDLCILDAEKDKKSIVELKKIKKNQPQLQSIHVVFDGILAQEIKYDDHSL